MARTSAISEEVWANAIRAVLVDKMSLRNAAQKFGVHHMSLHRRIKDLRGDKKPEKRDVGSRTPVAAAPTTPFMQPGMSMVNMMQMNMAQGLDTTKLPPPPTRLSSSSTYPVRASPLLQFRHHPYEGTSSPSTGRFPGIENASANMSAWFKAVQAVEMGHLDVHQAAATFHLDPNALHDHLSRQAPTSGREVPAEMFLTQIETHGVLKVVVARAEVGVKMDYDELADLVRRVLFVRPGPTSAAGNTGYFEHVMGSFMHQNEALLRSTMELHGGGTSRSPQAVAAAASPADTSRRHPPPHPQQQQQQQLDRAFTQERQQHMGDILTGEKAGGYGGAAYQRPHDRYSPSANLLIASNKINKPDYYMEQQPSRGARVVVAAAGPTTTSSTSDGPTARPTSDPHQQPPRSKDATDDDFVEV